MRKSKLYRKGAAFLAAVMVLTCMPQSGLYVSADEPDIQAELSGESEEDDQPELQEDTSQDVQPDVGEDADTSKEAEAEFSEVSSPDSDYAAPKESEPEIIEPEPEIVYDETPADGADAPAVREDPPAPAPIVPTGIKLNKEEMTLQRNTTEKLTFTIEPANADTDKDVTFASTTETVATVDQNGVVTAQAVGVSTITATTTNGRSASCTVTVTAIPVTKVTISQTRLEMKEPDPATNTAETANLEVNVLPNVAPNCADNLDMLVESSAPEIAEVTNVVKRQDGVYDVTVTAKRGGDCYIVARAQDDQRITARCDVFVAYRERPLTGLSAKPGTYEVYEGNSISLASFVVFEPLNTTEKELTWAVKSGSEDYVTVDANGRVTANTLPAGASDTEAYVTFTSVAKPAISSEFAITVKKKHVPVRSIRVMPQELALEDAGSNQTARVTVQITPAGSSERVVTAASDDTDVAAVYAGSASAPSSTATVDSYGRATFTVEGKKPGECKLTFSVGSLDPAVCDVTVTEHVFPVTNLRLPASLRVEELTDEELTAEIEPVTAENKNIDWTVSDPEIVSIVDGSGNPVERTTATVTQDAQGNDHLQSTVKIKGLMIGSCTVTATASGGVKKQCRVTVESAAVPAEGLVIKSDGGEEIQEITLKPGKTYKLIPDITPNNASNKKVRWSSSSPTVISLETGADYSCTVTANRIGSSTITAQASGESRDCTKTVTVNVIEPHLEVEYPENWSFVPEDRPVTSDKLKEQLEAWFYPVEDPDPEQDKTQLLADDYKLTIIGEDGKTELEDIETEMEKPGDRILVVSYDYDGVRYKRNVPVKMKEFSRANLVRVIPLSGEDSVIWNVENATPAASLPLPETAEIVVKGEKTETEVRVDAAIVWNVAGSGYNPANAQAQSFTVYGEVQLPEYVTNTDSVSLTVETEVHVREAETAGKAVDMPKFSVVGGGRVGNKTTVTLPYGSRIAVECDTEGVEIYYMLDRRPDPERGVPKDDDHRYTSPIEVTSKTTTIYAVASMSGYKDSECSECTIKLIPGEVVEPDDPNDPDIPIPDDVTDEDREQIGGEIPDGLWAAVQTETGEEDGFAYTGKAIKPEVHVYDYTRRLTEKKDYTVSYKNNVNAGSAKGSAKPPTIVVTGKGNYSGKAEVYFTIKPHSIADDAVLMDEYVAVAYTGKEKKPAPTLSWNGKKLSKDRDYTYPEVSYVRVGVYEVKVTGTGNYTGERKLNYEIFKGGVAVSDLKVTKVANQKYTGSIIKPPVTVTYKDTVLVEGTEKGSSGNYWVKYENCTGPGDASIVIVGKKNYKGSKRINFKILPTAKISQAGITLNVPAGGTPYTGEEIRPECTVNYAGTPLKKDIDYKIKYQNNIKAGTATVSLTGIGAFTGTAKKTFKILPNNISQLTVQMEKSYPYAKGGSKPKPVLIYGGRILQEGTDYTLVYKKNNMIGPSASVTVKGKGNYTGQISFGFEVTMQDIANLKVVATDKAYQQKANIYKTKVQVVDLNGKTLSAGSDYARDIVYTYASGAKEGEPILATDILPVGTLIRVQVRVTNPKNYQGTAYGTYRIVQADIARAKVSVEPQQYTGKKVRPKQSQMQVVLNGVMLRKEDYEIVGYENNINQGSGKVTIRGKGSYGGTKTVNFKIGKKGLFGLIF